MKKLSWILAIIITFFAINVFARDLSVIGVAKAPMRFTNTSGQHAGIDIDIIDYIFKKMDITYKVRLIKPSLRLIAFWESDKPEVDMVLTYSHKDSRAKYLIYPQESHFEIDWKFFILKKNLGHIKYNTFTKNKL